MEYDTGHSAKDPILHGQEYGYRQLPYKTPHLLMGTILLTTPL